MNELNHWVRTDDPSDQWAPLIRTYMTLQCSHDYILEIAQSSNVK